MNTNPTGDFPQQNQTPCPGCGRCPVCGRGGYQFYPPVIYPTWPPYYPYIGDGPYWQYPTITSTTTSQTWQ